MMYEKLVNDLHLLQKQLFWVDISFNECKKTDLATLIHTKNT
jgi:hypothetical protein